jgi:hypothetical protein
MGPTAKSSIPNTIPNPIKSAPKLNAIHHNQQTVSVCRCVCTSDENKRGEGRGVRASSCRPCVRRCTQSSLRRTVRRVWPANSWSVAPPRCLPQTNHHTSHHKSLAQRTPAPNRWVWWWWWYHEKRCRPHGFARSCAVRHFRGDRGVALHRFRSATHNHPLSTSTAQPQHSDVLRSVGFGQQHIRVHHLFGLSRVFAHCIHNAHHCVRRATAHAAAAHTHHRTHRQLLQTAVLLLQTSGSQIRADIGRN